jgi:hypothetical protein
LGAIGEHDGWYGHRDGRERAQHSGNRVHALLIQRGASPYMVGQDSFWHRVGTPKDRYSTA